MLSDLLCNMKGSQLENKHARIKRGYTNYICNVRTTSAVLSKPTRHSHSSVKIWWRSSTGGSSPSFPATRSCCKTLRDLAAVFKYEICSQPPTLFETSLLLRQPKKPVLADIISHPAHTGPWYIESICRLEAYVMLIVNDCCCYCCCCIVVRSV